MTNQNILLIDYLLQLHAEQDIPLNMYQKLKEQFDIRAKKIDLMDQVISCLYKGNYSIDTYMSKIEHEYRLLFDDFIDYSYLEYIFELSYKIIYVPNISDKEVLELLSLIIKTIKTCPDKDTKDQTYVAILEAICNKNLILDDIELTTEVVNYCKTIEPRDYFGLPKSVMYIRCR